MEVVLEVSGFAELLGRLGDTRFQVLLCDSGDRATTGSSLGGFRAFAFLHAPEAHVFSGPFKA